MIVRRNRGAIPTDAFRRENDWAPVPVCLNVEMFVHTSIPVAKTSANGTGGNMINTRQYYDSYVTRTLPRVLP